MAVHPCPTYETKLNAITLRDHFHRISFYANAYGYSDQLKKYLLASSFTELEAKHWILINKHLIEDTGVSYKDLTATLLNSAPLHGTRLPTVADILSLEQKQDESAASFLLRFRYEADHLWDQIKETVFINQAISKLNHYVADYVYSRGKPNLFSELAVLVNEFERERGHVHSTKPTPKISPTNSSPPPTQIAPWSTPPPISVEHFQRAMIQVLQQMYGNSQFSPPPNQELSWPTQDSHPKSQQSFQHPMNQICGTQNSFSNHVNDPNQIIPQYMTATTGTKPKEKNLIKTATEPHEHKIIISQPQLPKIEVQIQEEKHTALLDTGSVLSLIGKTAAQNFPKSEAKAEIISITQDEIKNYGAATIPLNISGVTTPHQFIVVDDFFCDIAIGIDLIRKLKLSLDISNDCVTSPLLPPTRIIVEKQEIQMSHPMQIPDLRTIDTNVIYPPPLTNCMNDQAQSKLPISKNDMNNENSQSKTRIPNKNLPRSNPNETQFISNINKSPSTEQRQSHRQWQKS